MTHFDIKGKKALVVGMGMSGRSAAQFLFAHQAIVTGVDKNETLLETQAEIQTLVKEGLTVKLESQCDPIETFDLLVLSPGIPQTHPLVQAAQRNSLPILGEIELGCQSVKNPILGITGTNGKTTVTLLVTHVLNQFGIQARALGNVGIPFTKELLTLSPEEWIVLELSSYQLETLYQKALDGAILLNITPDHLDRYGSMEAYAQAKFSMARNLKANGHLYIDELTWKEFGSLLKERNPRLYGYLPTSYIYTDLVSVFQGGKRAFDLPTPLKNKKSHELENFLAAYALCSDRGVPGDDFVKAWSSFKKPSHRIEFVTEHKGIRYYDDSKGTNLDAVIRAVQSLDGPIILIAGGVDKGAAYTPWLQHFIKKVKLVCAIGQAAAKMEDQIAPHIPVMIFNSLDEAVHQAAQSAVMGDIVLLSPGCASWDMFRDYAHRGEEFQRIVKEIVMR